MPFYLLDTPAQVHPYNTRYGVQAKALIPVTNEAGDFGVDCTESEYQEMINLWRKSEGLLELGVVTMRQARLALLQSGLLSQVDSAIAALPESEKAVAQIEWEYATEVKRNYPWVIALGAALGLTESQIDDLFAQAGTL